MSNVKHLFDDPSGRFVVRKHKKTQRQLQCDIKTYLDLETNVSMAAAIKRELDEYKLAVDRGYQVTVDKVIDDNIVSFSFEGTHTVGKIPLYTFEILTQEEANK